MSTFTWKKDEIDKNLPNYLKNELYQEMDNEDEKTSLSYLAKHTDTFKDFKKRYKYDKEIQEKDLPDLKDTTYTLAFEMNTNRYSITQYTLPQMTVEDLIKYSIKFYSYLRDPDLTHVYMNYLINERAHINIQNIGGRNITKVIRGRAIANDSKNVYISFYMKNILTDIIEYIHETAHMISLKLYVDKMNPLISKHFRELEAYYIELLASNFLGIEYKSAGIQDMLILNILEGAYDNAYAAIIQDIVAKHFIMPSQKRVNKELKKIGLKEEKDNISIFTRKNYGVAKDRYNSIMIAFDLFTNYQNDLEKGLSEYKRLLTSNISNIKELFSEFNITYTDNGCENAINATRKLKI